MAEDKGFEPLRRFLDLLVFKTSPFNRTWVILRMVTRTGFEPVNACVKGMCVNRFTNGPSYFTKKNGWASRIRTYECWYQKPVPYRLAIAQYYNSTL